jgi:sugar/nucleoside kinase (ribokinase family)
MIVGFGENSVDIVYRLPQYPQPGTSTSKVAIDRRDVRPGGQVATTLATCAALGLSTRYVGAFGNDEHGTIIRAELRRCGIDLSQALVREAANRYAVILVDGSQDPAGAASRGERVVLWHRDSRLAIVPADVRREWIGGATLVHVDETDLDAAVALARLARQAGLDVTCDIDQVTPDTMSLLDAVSIPILAEHVPAALTGESNSERALRALRHHHSGRLVVTLGHQGAAMLDGDRYLHASGLAVDVVDSTGAGDVFRGAFIFSSSRGDAPDQTLRFANAAAALACTKEGAMQSVPTSAEVERVLART